MFKYSNAKVIDFFKMWWNKSSFQSDISPSQAKKIQKQQEIFKIDLENRCFPPYLTIAAQLGSSEQQIFEAAVIYLCDIADNKPKYQKSIAKILETYKVEHNQQFDRVSFIENMMLKSNFNAH